MSGCSVYITIQRLRWAIGKIKGYKLKVTVGRLAKVAGYPRGKLEYYLSENKELYGLLGVESQHSAPKYTVHPILDWVAWHSFNRGVPLQRPA
ncbi:MAG: hypothetical protein JWO43_526 [Candidatus Adlerbacteria bacterium]|nr:hypothetical protein [Candidatus Adlerbacteria bacterium]